jgi:hypothetical protein
MLDNRTAEGIRVGTAAAIATLLLALLASLLVAPAADAATVKSFKPVHKTKRALVFKPRGIPADAIRDARVRFKKRAAGSREVDVERLRSVVSRGKKLRVRFKSGARMRSGKGGKQGGAKGKGSGRLDVEVTPTPTPGSGDSSTAPQPGQPAPGLEPAQPAPTPAPHPGQVYTVPSSVPTGCSTDATSKILSWIDSVPNSSTLRFGAGACYRIEGTLELRNRTLTIDGNGSTFKSLNAPSSHRALWRAFDSTAVFRNMTLVGSYANGGTHSEQLQWAHGIDLRGTRAIVEKVTMSDLAGDCVYFGLGASRSSGTVRDSSCRRIGRNGVSVVAGDDILVERTTTSQIGYIAFDVEPNGGGGNGSSRVSFDSNTIGTYSMKAYTVIGNAPIADQRFTNNRVVGKGLEVGVVNNSHRPQRLRISGNVSDTQSKHNTMNLEGVGGMAITGNTVPLVSGATMAQVRHSCDAAVSGNSFPGGSRESSITDSQC